MLNPLQKLHPKVFEKDVELMPIRKGFGEGFALLGEKDPRVVGLCADLTESTQMHLFRDKFPHRFVQVGVAEQNLAAVASGLAAGGKVPFMSSYAMFSPGRNWEQIRTTICYNNQKVVIVGSHAGLSVGPDGGTHQAIEDIALMRVLPRMTVLSPCDAVEAKKAALASVKIPGPVYIRLSREKTPVMTTELTPFTIGKAGIFFEPEHGPADVGIIATGALVHYALRAAWALQASGKKVKVLNMATIKPLDKEAVLALAQETKAIVTVEEHQIAGGLGSAVAEYLASIFPVVIEFVGVRDEFGQSGTATELLAHYGLGISDIERAAEKAIRRKS